MALRSAEDEDDVRAMRRAERETAADMDEFENNNDNNNGNAQEKRKAEDAKPAEGAPAAAPAQDAAAVMGQLSPIERYAVRYIEETGIFVLPSFLPAKGAVARGAAGKENADAGGGGSDDEDDPAAGGGGEGLVSVRRWNSASASAAYQLEVARAQRGDAKRRRTSD